MHKHQRVDSPVHSPGASGKERNDTEERGKSALLTSCRKCCTSKIPSDILESRILLLNHASLTKTQAFFGFLAAFRVDLVEKHCIQIIN